MTQPKQELQERFDDVVGVSDTEGFFLALCEFLRYVSETPELNRHARTILTSTQLSSSMYGISALWKELNKRWFDDYNASEQVWADLSRKMLGKEVESNVPLIFTDLQSSRSALRVFYMKLVAEIDKQGVSSYGKTSVTFDKAENSIYLSNDESRRYNITSRRSDKTKAPKRFRIVTTLYSQKNGVSITRLNELLDTDTQVLKTAIRDINILFEKNVTDDGLIKITKKGNKNMYSLNRESFNFRVK